MKKNIIVSIVLISIMLCSCQKNYFSKPEIFIGIDTSIFRYVNNPNGLNLDVFYYWQDATNDFGNKRLYALKDRGKILVFEETESSTLIDSFFYTNFVTYNELKECIGKTEEEILIKFGLPLQKRELDSCFSYTYLQRDDFDFAYPIDSIINGQDFSSYVVLLTFDKLTSTLLHVEEKRISRP